MKEIGVVFGGGGAKGSYETGVWRALEEMDFNVSAVCGTSIGAVNGAIIAQGDFDLLARMWTDISLKDIVNASYPDAQNLFDIKNIPHIAADICKNQAIDVTPFKLLIHSLINEDKIRSSRIDYGLSVYSVTDKRGTDIWKDDIPKGHMADYIIASAAMFGIPSPSYNDKVFFDGCIKNNIPVNMMLDKGFKNILAVDVGGFGMVKNIDSTGINIFNLKCSENIIGTMDFDASKIRKSIKMGYLDTFRIFGHLAGDKYYIETNSLVRSRNIYSQSILSGIEKAASAFAVDRFRAYEMNELIDKVIKRYKRYNVYYRKMKEKLSEDSIFNIITQKKIKLNDALIVAWITDLIRNGRSDFINNKLIMNLLGSNYDAAGSLAYLLGEKER